MLLPSRGVAIVSGSRLVTFAATAYGILPRKGLPLMFGVCA
jgi:hypothetical protein